MTYICHDTVENTSAIDVKGWMGRIAGWMNSFQASRTANLLDPRNEHLQKDIGISVADCPAIFSQRTSIGANRLPYSPMGNNLQFIDLFLSEHLDRGPR